MYNHNTTSTEKRKELKDTDRKGKERPWKEKKNFSILVGESFARLGSKKASRVLDCGSLLEFKRFEDDSLKLHQANFCKVRLCPMCGWRRSLKIFGQVSKVMDSVPSNARFVFLTLTCRNVGGEDLSSQIDTMFKAYKKMSERKQFKTAVKGWFRALEVTHNVEQDTYHPHFHAILMVNKSYFNDPKYYINQDQWTQLWKEALAVDYTPLVDVRAVKGVTHKTVSEVAKYSVKDTDLIIRKNGVVDTKKTDSVIEILDTALAHRRLYAFGGELRSIYKALNLADVEKADLIDLDSEDTIRNDLSYVLERYRWHIGFRQYKLEKRS